MAKLYWVIVNSETGVPVPPVEENPGRDEALLVFTDMRSAEDFCVFHKETYDLDCKPCLLGNEKTVM